MDTAARLLSTKVAELSIRSQTYPLTAVAVRCGRGPRLAILIDEGDLEAQLSRVDVVIEQLAIPSPVDRDVQLRASLLLGEASP